MKIIKRIMTGMFCLTFCLLLVACSTKTTTATPIIPATNEQTTANFLGLAIYQSTSNDKLDEQNINTITKNSISTNLDNSLNTNNNFVNLIYSKNNFKNDAEIFSNTTFNLNLNSITKSLKLDMEVFLETKYIYVFEIISNNNNLSLNLIATTNFANGYASVKCKNLSSSTKSIFNEITITFNIDLTTENNYQK